MHEVGLDRQDRQSGKLAGQRRRGRPQEIARDIDRDIGGGSMQLSRIGVLTDDPDPNSTTATPSPTAPTSSGQIVFRIAVSARNQRAGIAFCGNASPASTSVRKAGSARVAIGTSSLRSITGPLRAGRR
ncbi:unnamed protein product [Sordaria macrospora k-hell]|uniref:WGS project CABT00000000 data, contig 2.473 n=1 Tax=Sordaria macrospora (strain ATCC MYA-333 / DSM 997 / K(L3346) / K-hell) TaxID=771870 RepID=F7WCZ7_SORMK|nr:unnamed protein product [Sordaria macrospora k-hell]